MKIFAFAVFALLAGCGSGEAEQKGATPADTRTAPGKALANPPASAIAVDSAAIRAGCRGVRVAFDSIAAQLRDAAVIASPRDTLAEFPGILRGGREYACVTTLEDSTTGASTTDSLHLVLERSGWQMRSALIDADSPDGETLPYSRADAVCVLRSSWDGGDDDDTTYVPHPGVHIQVICYADRPNP